MTGLTPHTDIMMMLICNIMIHLGPGVALRFRRPPARNPWLQPLRGCGATLPGGQDRWPDTISSHYLHSKHQAGLMCRNGWVTTTFRLLS